MSVPAGPGCPPNRWPFTCNAPSAVLNVQGSGSEKAILRRGGPLAVDLINARCGGLPLGCVWSLHSEVNLDVKCFCSVVWNYGTSINLRKHQILRHSKTEGSRTFWVCPTCGEEVPGFPRIQPLKRHCEMHFPTSEQIQLRHMGEEELLKLPGAGGNAITGISLISNTGIGRKKAMRICLLTGQRTFGVRKVGVAKKPPVPQKLFKPVPQEGAGKSNELR